MEGENKLFVVKSDYFYFKYFDDRNYILGITFCGDALSIYKNKNSKKYKQLINNFNKQLMEICNKLFDKYRLYHNDLRYTNICVDKYDKIYLIDFDHTSYRLKYGEKKYYKLR